MTSRRSRVRNADGGGQPSILHTQSLEDVSSALARSGIKVVHHPGDGGPGASLGGGRKSKRNVHGADLGYRRGVAAAGAPSTEIDQVTSGIGAWAGAGVWSWTCLADGDGQVGESADIYSGTSYVIVAVANSRGGAVGVGSGAATGAGGDVDPNQGPRSP